MHRTQTCTMAEFVWLYTNHSSRQLVLRLIHTKHTFTHVTHTHTNTHPHTHAHTHTHTHARTLTHPHTHIHTRTHPRTHIHTHNAQINNRINKHISKTKKAYKLFIVSLTTSLSIPPSIQFLSYSQNTLSIFSAKVYLTFVLFHYS